VNDEVQMRLKSIRAQPSAVDDIRQGLRTVYIKISAKLRYEPSLFLYILYIQRDRTKTFCTKS